MHEYPPLLVIQQAMADRCSMLLQPTTIKFSDNQFVSQFFLQYRKLEETRPIQLLLSKDFDSKYNL